MAFRSELHVRMEPELKAKGLAALESMGLTAAEAVRLLFHRIAADHVFPLELKVPNGETRVAMAEADAIIAARIARAASAADRDGTAA